MSNHNINRLSFADQHIFVGLDVSNKSWKTCILTEHFEHKTFTQPANVEILVQYLRRNFPDATYHCVYEAGYFGFWIHDRLRKHGINCFVANPADIPTSHREARRKSDKIDARKLARNLRNGEIDPIFVPDQNVRQDRSLVRMRYWFSKKLTRCKNQIKAFLKFYGVQIPDNMHEKSWSKKYISWLQQIELSRQSGNAALGAMIEELLFLRQNILVLSRQIQLLSQQPHYHEHIVNLTSIPGISTFGAMTLLTEIVDISRFKTLDNLASFAGLVPDESSSGDERNITGLTKRRNPSMRRILVESSWIAVRKDPALTQAFNQLTLRMTKQKAIIRVARKLLSRIRYVLINHCTYKTLTV